MDMKKDNKKGYSKKLKDFLNSDINNLHKILAYAEKLGRLFFTLSFPQYGFDKKI